MDKQSIMDLATDINNSIKVQVDIQTEELNRQHQATLLSYRAFLDNIKSCWNTLSYEKMTPTIKGEFERMRTAIKFAEEYLENKD